MQKLITVFFLFIASFSFSQIELDKVKHDFGELESYSIRYVDIRLTNKSEKQEWLLSVKKPFDPGLHQFQSIYRKGQFNNCSFAGQS